MITESPLVTVTFLHSATTDHFLHHVYRIVFQLLWYSSCLTIYLIFIGRFHMISPHPARGNNKPVANCCLTRQTYSQRINTYRRSQRIDTSPCTVRIYDCTLDGTPDKLFGYDDRTGEHCYYSLPPAYLTSPHFYPCENTLLLMHIVLHCCLSFPSKNACILINITIGKI